MDTRCLKKFFTGDYLVGKIAAFNAACGQLEPEFATLNSFAESESFIELFSDVKECYLTMIAIRPSVDRNKGTHVSDIFTQLSESVIQLVQQCNDFLKEIKHLDPEYTLSRMKTKLEHVKEFDESRTAAYGFDQGDFDEEVDNFILKRTKYQAMADLDTMIFNMVAGLFEMHGLQLSNPNEIKEMINYQKKSY